MKEIILLGSTGSIGTQSLDIVRQNRDRFTCSVLCCGSNVELLRKQIDEFGPKTVVVAKEEDAKALQADYPKLNVLFGDAGIKEAVKESGDVVINALVGIRGLVPTMTAIEAGKTIALANKETLVTGGSLVMNAVKEKGVELLPVDSEHSAIFQCLQGHGGNKLRKIHLTASGGPFRGRSLEELKNVKLEDALKHPNWSMGQKITIDSATMMNKCLEVIEAKHLFDVKPEQIEVLVHPQSIVHSMIEYDDGAVIAQLGTPDMRLPISYALTYPERLDNGFDKLDMFTQGANLTFEKPDPTVFKGIKFAYDVLNAGPSYPIVLNGANEVLVGMFLERKIGFLDIQNTIEKLLDEHKSVEIKTTEDVVAVDLETRALAREAVK